MLIDAINLTHYPRDRSRYTTETVERPSWDVVDRELRSMHNWEKPILRLHQNRNVGDSNCMAVTGGSGTYHIQVADAEGYWRQAVDPDGSDEETDVWLSDQGFATEVKFTWTLERAIELVRWYYEHATAHPRYTWTPRPAP